MNRKHIIVVICYGTIFNTVYVFGNFKKACLKLGLPYHSLKGLKFPIKINDKTEIFKEPFN